MKRHGLEISALAYYPNNLDPDPAAREAANSHLKRVIEAAQRLEVGVVGTFVGRDQHRNVTENLEDFEKVWPPIVRFAREHGVKVAIENCPMIFSDDEWPGGRNLAYSPAHWRRMFEIVPDDNFGLNLDPSHLVWQFIDYVRVVRDFGSRIFHVHAKDMEVDRDGLYEHGVMSLGVGWQVPRLPGLGEVRWDRFIAALYAVGYDWVVSVEHEDRKFEGSLELVQRGFIVARNALKPLIV
jgi:sugar phosphate isomerase/epimerase